MTRNTCFLYKLRCTSYGNTALVRLYLIQLAHILTWNDSSLSIQMEGHVFHFTVTVLYTTCCLIPKRKVPSACNDQHIHYSFQFRDTALFFFPSFTSVYPGNIGRMLTNRSQTNQRVQKIHHNIKTGVLRDVSIDILVHAEKINTHEAEDYNGQYGIKQKWTAHTFSWFIIIWRTDCKLKNKMRKNNVTAI